MTPEEIKKEIEAALSSLSADSSLAYLAVTSKPELPVRDRVAWYLHRKHPDFIVAREYTIKSEKNRQRRKKVDLALLKASRDPVALVEFKAMSASAPLSNPKHSLMVSLKGDLERLAKITRVPRFGVMLKVHIENMGPLKQRGLDSDVVKYASKFRRWAEEPGPFEKAIKIAEGFFERANLNVSSLTINLGSVWGARVKLTALILEP